METEFFVMEAEAKSHCVYVHVCVWFPAYSENEAEQWPFITCYSYLGEFESLKFCRGGLLSLLSDDIALYIAGLLTPEGLMAQSVMHMHTCKDTNMQVYQPQAYSTIAVTVA